MLDTSLDRSAAMQAALGRFPLKPTWDALSLAQVLSRNDFSAAQKFACVRFYFSGGGINNLYATLTRSGSHWSLLGIALAMDLMRGGDVDYRFENDCWIPTGGAIYTKLDWREPADDWDSELDPAVHGIIQTKKAAAGPTDGVTPRAPVVFHSHLPLCRLRCAGLRHMNIAVMLRSIYDSMESKYYKHQTLIGMGVTPLEGGQNTGTRNGELPSEENEYHFPWEVLLADAIEFYNSWGDALQRLPHIRLFRYDDLMASPAEAHKELTDFWGLDVPLDCMQEAFARITKDKMAEKIFQADLSTTSRVAKRTQGAALSPERVSFIQHWLEKRLKHDFGYGTTWAKK